MTQVAAAIIQKDGKLLICQRGEGGNCAFLWEFPGGKLEEGESPQECAVRECMEELNLSVRITGVFGYSRYRYPDREIAFTFLNAEYISGELMQNVHNAIRWVTPSELKEYPFCPADREIIERLSSPFSFGTKKRGQKKT